jgi:hypothetical protein
MAHFFVHSLAPRVTFLFFIWLKTKILNPPGCEKPDPCDTFLVAQLSSLALIPAIAYLVGDLSGGSWIAESPRSTLHWLHWYIFRKLVGCWIFGPMLSLVRNSWPMVSWEWKSHSPWTRDSECLDQVQTVFQKPAISKLVCLMGVGPPFSWSGKIRKLLF